MSDYRRNLAWKAGRKAALAGKPKSANNRQPCTIFFDDWADGYGEGLRERDIAALRARATSETSSVEGR